MLINPTTMYIIYEYKRKCNTKFKVVNLKVGGFAHFRHYAPISKNHFTLNHAAINVFIAMVFAYKTHRFINNIVKIVVGLQLT